MKKLILIDGNSLIYRAFYAISYLSTSDGKPTNAAYGFTRMLIKLLEEEKPDMIAIALDVHAPTFRHKEFDEYKANRPQISDDLISQLPIIREVINTFNIPIYEKEGYEADDVLGTIAKCAEKEGIQAAIVTGDLDCLQLASDNVKIVVTTRGITETKIFGIKEVEERFGVFPEQIPDYKAIVGDKTDNIPGVKGIGETKAVTLIREFGSLENLYKNLYNINDKKLHKLIQENRDKAELSKNLARIRTDVPIEFKWEEMKLKDMDEKALLELFIKYEFKSLAKNLSEDVEKEEKEKEKKYFLVTDEEGLNNLIDNLYKKGEFTVNLETTSKDPMVAKIVGLSLCYCPYEAYYIPFNYKMSSELLLTRLKPIIEDENVKKYGQNIKYDIIVFKRNGIDIKGVNFDTMIASYLLNPSKQNHNLEDLAIEYLHHIMTPISNLIGKNKGYITMADVDIEKVKTYACADADITYRLKGVFEEKLIEKNLIKLFYNVEMPLIEVLTTMEMNGMAVDISHLNDLSKRMSDKIDELIEEIYELAGESFNINSTKQLQYILFEKIKLQKTKRTKTGYSTDSEVLNALASQHKIVQKIIRHRELTKLKSTYVDTLIELARKTDESKTASFVERVHTSFNQTVTATGRLSSSDPNLQNIPVKGEWGPQIRRAFITESNRFKVLCADYSQIELRILAHLSRDPLLIKAFMNNEDIHIQTAIRIFGVKEDGVTGDMRRKAKTVNFGIIYGMNEYGLSKELNITPEEARLYIESYFKVYEGVKGYIENVKEEVRKNGYVTTILNRRRYIPDINSVNKNIRLYAERTAINTPVQGSAADLIKVSMIKIHNLIKQRGFISKMILQVHDELVFEVFEEEIEELSRQIVDIMKNAIPLVVPIKVDVKIGNNLGEVEK